MPKNILITQLPLVIVMIFMTILCQVDHSRRRKVEWGMFRRAQSAIARIQLPQKSLRWRFELTETSPCSVHFCMPATQAKTVNTKIVQQREQLILLKFTIWLAKQNHVFSLAKVRYGTSKYISTITKKVKHWNLKHVHIQHDIYIIVDRDLINVIFLNKFNL